MKDADTVPFANLGLQWRQIRDKALPDMERLFEASAFCLGPWVERFEEAAADYLGVSHAIAVNSGSSALHLAVIAAGIGPGDKVMVPAQTFIGTLWGAIYQGAIPVLCDVDAKSGTIDPAEIERRMEPGVKAIIPVHLFGQPADMAPILESAERHGLTVIEDVAQAIAGRYRGRALGGIGQMGCFSFYPGKNLGAAGEGGLISTNDDAIAARLRALRSHGQYERYLHAETGYNYRMEGLQGLILGHKLPYLEAWTDERRAIARRYNAGLAGLPIDLPQIIHGDHVWHLYVLRTPDRDRLRQHMTGQGVETGLHYPVPIHRQPCLAHLDLDRDGYPEADRWANQGLSLPVFAGMTIEQQDRVIAAVRSFF
jgi:dTDP-4-amino-4,6-dideoxygalactose transaminase